MKPSTHAIEDWAKNVAQKQMRQLTDEETRDFIRYCLVSKQLDKDQELINLLNNKKAGYASVLWLRIKTIHTYSITPSLCIYLGECVIKNFGMSTMIANYLQYIAKTKGLKTIGFDEFSRYAFPMGYPTDKSWNELWDLQKIDLEFRSQDCYRCMDNILDYPQFMESLKF